MFFIFSALSRYFGGSQFGVFVLFQLPGVFDIDYVITQLRHGGILETIHVRKRGFPIRIPFNLFMERYCSTVLVTFLDIAHI